MGKKLWIVGGPSAFAYGGTVQLFKLDGWEMAKSLKEADLLSFQGGEDICPDLYNEPAHPKTYYDKTRDNMEVAQFNIGLALGKPMVGICRGAQLLNVLCGGTLWQNVDRHARNGLHEVIDVISKRHFFTTSLHHQMMRPAKEALVIGIAHESTKKERMKKDNTINIVMSDGKRGVDNYDPEVVFYEKQQCLCFQGHPEFGGNPTLSRVFLDYVNTYLFGSGYPKDTPAEKETVPSC